MIIKHNNGYYSLNLDIVNLIFVKEDGVFDIYLLKNKENKYFNEMINFYKAFKQSNSEVDYVFTELFS